MKQQIHSEEDDGDRNTTFDRTDQLDSDVGPRGIPDAYLRVKGTGAAEWLWDQVLTPTEREKLGGDLEEAYFRYRGAVGMWMSLRGVSIPQAVVTVATRLGFINAEIGLSILRSLGEEPDDPTERVEAAVAAGGLVLVEMPREAYWCGEPIEIDWARHTSQWELLWGLARLSKGGGVVDAFALQEREEKDLGFVRKRKCRLVNANGFPQSLADLVVGAGRGTYRLDLLPTRIRLFERGTGDVECENSGVRSLRRVRLNLTAAEVAKLAK